MNRGIDAWRFAIQGLRNLFLAQQCICSVSEDHYDANLMYRYLRPKIASAIHSDTYPPTS